MNNEERKSCYLVVLNRETILGEFSIRDDALMFAYISALHGDDGDTYEIYGGLEGFDVG